ncbi:BatD family protein [Psychrobium sp. 1_MG-2023]|uniref:BatD family protein n=1 Tax=Psychrobium sp. 1_MG-2023 TaxID=3062624 RepID=UPI000C32BD0B|nr:BatD family protein [Psychrobium sp. 1_MG-2023]MDP2561739.1 BatD family protein [Psychrobium sp. 1_MG-2023]PKF59772.1 hypothetical protein CW748_00815 [Alteromonadales bacterium alter-6D02]
MVTRILITLLLLAISPISQAITSLSASLDRNPAMVGETFTLTLTANGEVEQGDLDSSALLKQFIVGQTSFSDSTRIVNNKISRQTSWAIRLVARTAGTYTIPSFVIGNVASDPITIEITKHNSNAAQPQQIKLEADIASEQAYVGQQLLYTVKLYIGVNLQRAQLQSPQLEGADIAQLSEDKESSEIVDGVRYRVITRQYSIRPTLPGSLELQGAIFQGDISLTQRHSFFSTGRSKPVTLLTDNVMLEVSPIPDDFPGQWLVSDFVVLEDAVDTTKTYKVGEPITRTLTLSVANATPEQLPELLHQYGNQVQAYPDQAQTKQTIQGSTLIAQMQQKVALIPTQSGVIKLPEIKIPWLNSQTREIEWATIPAKQLQIVADENKSVAPSVTPEVTAPSSPMPAQSVAMKPQVIIKPSASLIYWQIGCAILLIGLIVTGYIIYRLKQTQTLPAAPVQANNHIQSNQLLSLLLQAIKQQQASEVARLFPLWLKRDYNLNTVQLADIAPELLAQYQSLAQSCYSSHSANINFSGLTQLIKQFVSDQHKKNKNELGGLYH